MNLSIDIYFSIFVISGCFFSFFVSLAIFIKPRDDRRKFLEGAVFLLASLWMFCAYHRLFLGKREDNLFIVGTILFAFFVPVLYLYIRMLQDTQFSLIKKHFILFVIPLLLLPVFMVTFRFPPGFYELFNIRPLEASLRYSILMGATFAENLYLFVMLFVLNMQFVKIFRTGRDNRYHYLRYFFVLTFFLNLIIGFYFVNYFLELKMIKYSYITGTILLYYFFVIYFIFFAEISTRYEEEKKQPDGDCLKGLDLPGLQARLEALMCEEKLYRSEDLTQRALAEKLRISPQQLSALFGVYIKNNYYSYLNAWRINEAKELLLNAPEMKILEIALHVGFNSQSSFYSAFKGVTGISPREYRKSKV